MAWRNCRSSVKIFVESLYSPRQDLRREDGKNTSGHTASVEAVSGVDRPIPNRVEIEVNRRDIDPLGTING